MARRTTKTVPALGGYVKALRAGRGFTMAEVQRAYELRIGQSVDDGRFWGVEGGERWPVGDFLAVLMDILGGSMRHIVQIAQHPAWKAEDGQRLADEALAAAAPIIEQEARAFMAQLKPEEIARLITVAQSMSPEDFDRWVRMGAALSENESPDSPAERRSSWPA